MCCVQYYERCTENVFLTFTWGINLVLYVKFCTSQNFHEAKMMICSLHGLVFDLIQADYLQLRSLYILLLHVIVVFLH